MARVYYNEWDRKTAAWLRQLIRDGLIADGDVDERSITQVRPDDLVGYTQCHFFAGIGGWSYALRLAGWPDDRPVWTGSCPCQPFSTSGPQTGTGDDRDLWPAFAGLISESLPPVVFGEQVASAIRWGWVDRLAHDLEAASYAVGTVVLPAGAAGAPHRRDRLFWLATNPECERRQEPRKHRPIADRGQADAFREADRLLDAVRRGALPFLCGKHDGLPPKLGEVAMRGFGNAIVPQVAATFIAAYLDTLMETV